MAVRITTLSENTAGPGMLAEWGLSVLVETDEQKVLLDTCASISVPRNAPILGVDLSKIDRIVLSHGHYDHTGGLRDVLGAMGKKVEVIAHPDMWAAKQLRIGEQYIYIGIPFSREELEGLGASFTLSREPVWISDDIVTTGEIPMVTEYEEIDPVLYVKENDEFVPDPLLDDRALIIKTDEGLVVVLGCAHRGVINTLYHAQQVTGVERIHTVIGGTHLVSATEERVLLTAAAFQELGVQRVGVSHCTGLPAAMILARELGEIFFFNNAGTRLTLE
ncbi:MAG: MBL fold metallo-hydrolase [Dehalococcoidia bacterium]|nr:MAG: MBL fold metallo-hydrolase [Dehalococcoidia bacterium]